MVFERTGLPATVDTDGDSRLTWLGDAAGSVAYGNAYEEFGHFQRCHDIRFSDWVEWV